MSATAAFIAPSSPARMAMPAADDVQIEIRNVGKTYGSKASDAPVIALDGVNLNIRKGEFISLLGPSGCGKSTLLSIIAGFQSATTGQILQNGRPITRPDPSRTVVFQDYALFGWMTVQQNVEFGLKAKGMPRRSGPRSPAPSSPPFISAVSRTSSRTRCPAA